jgi:EmrB/QacA subfamily drug resistance transporter
MESARVPCDSAAARAVTVDSAGSTVVNPRWILAATILGSGMTFIDSTVVNVVLPVIGGQLQASASQLQWIVEAYLLFLTSLMLLGGSLGDRYGRRRLFIAGIVFFAAASAWCGLASGVTQLILARALQGVGAAMLVPGSLAIIRSSFNDRERGAAIGAWAAGTSIAAGGGPVLGGWLVEHLSWRWIFLINLPLAVVTVWIAATRLPETGGRDRGCPLDWRGACLATGGLAALVYGLVHAGSHGLSAPRSVVACSIGAILLVAFALVEWRLERRSGAGAAMMPLSLFSSRAFTATNVLTVFLYSALSMVFFVLPFALIDRHGYSVVQASSALLPFVLVMFVVSPWAGRLADRHGPRLPLVAGPLIVAGGYVLMMRVAGDGRYITAVLPAVMMMSVGMSIAVAPLTMTVMAAVDARHAGLASGVNNAVSRLASLLAVAIVGLISSGQFAMALARTSLIASGLAVAGALACAVLLRTPTDTSEGPDNNTGVHLC